MVPGIFPEKLGLFFFLFCFYAESFFDKIAYNIAQPYTKGKREGHYSAPENDEKADGYNGIANAYILKNNSKGNNYKKNSYTLCYGVAISDVCVLTTQINYSADKIAQNNPDNNNNNGHNNEGKSACNSRGIFSKLAYANEIQAKGKEDYNKYPKDNLAYHKRWKGVNTTFLQEIDNSNLVRPFIKTEKDQKPR
jgi:hypothetical protein